MNKKVLIVDDDEKIIKSFERNLSRFYTVRTAESAKKAIAIIKNDGPFAVVVSDLKMPEIDGITLLAAVSELSKHTVKIMLTGYADVESSIAAVNKGHVFRFLTKPINVKELKEVIDAGIEQYRLVNIERIFLQKTLRGCVQVLSDIMSMTNSEAFARGERVKHSITRMCNYISLKKLERVEIAAMLSQIGCLAIPEDLLQKKYSGGRLGAEEEQIVAMHPIIGSSLLANIPYLEDIAEILLRQEEEFDIEAPLEHRIMRLALDFDTYCQSGVDKYSALQILKQKWPVNTDVFEAFEKAVCEDEGFVKRILSLEELTAQMILDESMMTTAGTPLLVKGQELTEQHIERIEAIKDTGVIKEPIKVVVPLASLGSCSCSLWEYHPEAPKEDNDE